MLKLAEGGGCAVLYRNIDDQRPEFRRAHLLDSAEDDKETFEGRYEVTTPHKGNNFSLKPIKTDSSDYDQWPFVMDICKSDRRGYESGMHESRGWTLIDVSRSALEDRMRSYYDPSVSWEELCESDHGMTKAKSLYDNPRRVRENVLQNDVYDDNSIIRWAVFPMDVRYAYATCARSVWNAPRPDLQPLRFGNDKFLVFPASMSGKEVGFPVIFSSVIGSYHLMSSQTMFFPFFDYAPSEGILSEQKTANLSDEARNWLSELGFCDPDTDDDVAALPWFHILAICYSRRYAEGNIEMLKVDYPKIPMPSSSDGLVRSSKLGKRVAALLNVEQAAHDLIPRGVKKLAGVFGKDYRVSKKWTKVTKRGISPGKGIVSLPRDWDETEVPVLQEAFASLEIDERRGFELIGKAYDIYLNDNRSYWKGVPEAVWKCRIGTRQVIQKWLSYRSETLIDRDLDVDEVRHVREIVWRLTTLILMTCDLDANYEACCNNAFRW